MYHGCMSMTTCTKSSVDGCSDSNGRKGTDCFVVVVMIRIRSEEFVNKGNSCVTDLQRSVIILAYQFMLN